MLSVAVLLLATMDRYHGRGLSESEIIEALQISPTQSEVEGFESENESATTDDEYNPPVHSTSDSTESSDDNDQPLVSSDHRDTATCVDRATIALRNATTGTRRRGRGRIRGE